MTYNIHKGIRAAVAMYNRNHGTQIDPDLAIKIMHAESSGNPNATGKKDGKAVAFGLMMLTPAIAKYYNVDYNDPRDNVKGGIRYLGDLYSKYNGDVHLITAAYNAGETQVNNHISKLKSNPMTAGLTSKEMIERLPDYLKETRDYHKKVLYGIDANGKPFNPSLDDTASPVIAGTRSTWDAPQEKPVKVTTEHSGPSITDNEFFAVSGEMLKKLKSLDDKTPGGQARSQIIADLEDHRREIAKLSPERRRQFLQKDLVDGLASGFAQGSQEKTIAQNRGATRGSLGYTTGFTLAKTVKGVAEAGLNIAGMGVLSGVKAPGVLLSTIDHFWNGFKLSGGANLATNLAGETLGATLPGQNYKTLPQVGGSVGHLAGEAGIAGLMGGAFNSGLLRLPGSSLEVQRKSNNLAAQKTYNDFDAFSTERGRQLQPLADDVETHSHNVLKKMASAKSAEEAPIKAAMNASDKALAESTDKIPLGDFSDDLIKIVEEADVHSKDPIIASHPQIQDLRRLFNLTEDRNMRGGVNVSDLPRIRDNIDVIMREGASGESPAVKQFADKLYRIDALDSVISKIPTNVRENSLAWKNVQIKYGDPWKAEYSTLNHAYDRYNPKTLVLDVDGLTAHNTLVNTKNRAVNNKIGSLVDSNVISVDDISKVYQNDAAAVAAEKSSFGAASGAGNAGNVKNFISSPNNPHQLIDKVSSDISSAPIGKVPHTGDVMQYDPVEVVPDIKYYAKRLRQTSRSLNASLGETGRSEAKNIRSEGNRLGSLFKGQSSVGANRGKMEKINTIQEARYNEQAPGAAMASAPYSEVGLTKEVDFAKVLRMSGMLGVQPVRELGEDFLGSTFANDGTGGKGPFGLLGRMLKVK
jgi:hypothetical protein